MHSRPEEELEPLLAVDIGSSKIRLIAGTVEDNSGEVHVLYFQECPSSGVTNGAVSDIDKLSNCLSKMIQDYKDTMDLPFEHCVINIAGSQISSANNDGTSPISTRKVTEVDRINALSVASSYQFAKEHHIIHAIPQYYETDGSREVSNPLGMSSLSLTAHVHLVACNESQENNLRTAFERVSPSIKIDEVLYSGIAAADAVLSQEDKDIGVCLVDLGGGSIDVALYNRGKLIYSFGREDCGVRITRDISTNCGLHMRPAEFIKITRGVAHPDLLENPETVFAIKARSDSDEKLYIKGEDLARNICSSLWDIFGIFNNQVDNFIKQESIDLSLGGGVVFTGGVANTIGIEPLGRSFFENIGKRHVKVRVGVPRGFDVAENVTTDLKSPEYATAIGMLRLAAEIEQNRARARKAMADFKSSNRSITKVLAWIKDWLNREFF